MPNKQVIHIPAAGLVIHGFRLRECDDRSIPAVCILPGLTIKVDLN